MPDSQAEQEFERLASRLQSLSGTVLAVMPPPADTLSLPEGAAPPRDTGNYYRVDEGALRITRGDRVLCELGPGSLWLPASGDPSAYTATAGPGTRLSAWRAGDFLWALAAYPEVLRAFTDWLQSGGALLQLLATGAEQYRPLPATGHASYGAGDVIIRQGDRADYVFHMTSGSAEVQVDGIVVGEIGPGEIFGAMAALTNADRTATVRATGPCEVLKVPRDEFSELIRTNPATIHSLLVDMANSIVSLNEQLVGLRGTR